MSHPRPGIGLVLANTQIDKSAGNSGRIASRTLRGLASLARPNPALQIRPASGHPIGRPLQTERVTPPLGYVSGQCTSNSPSIKVARGERGYETATAAIIRPSPTARHPQGDQPPIDPSIRPSGDERDLLPKAALRVVAADRAHRFGGVGRDRGDPPVGVGAPPPGPRRSRPHRPAGGAGGT